MPNRYIQYSNPFLMVHIVLQKISTVLRSFLPTYKFMIFSSKSQSLEPHSSTKVILEHCASGWGGESLNGYEGGNFIVIKKVLSLISVGLL